MNRAQIRTIIRENLSDDGVSTNFQDEDINQSINDAYNDIVSKSKCIVKSVTLNWLPNVNYYDFLSGNNNANTAVLDFLGVIGIFNNVNNLWLRDDVPLRDFDSLRYNWELWNGVPQFRCYHSMKYDCIVPKLNVSNGGTFILWYWGKIVNGFGAPNDASFDVTEPLIAPDMQSFLFEKFVMADLYESIENVGAASQWWPQYFFKLNEYKSRCKKNCASDILERV